MVQAYANHLPTSVDRYTDHRRGFLLTDLASVYAFGGTELIGVTVGEAQNPRVVMPKAVKMTFFRIAFFYILSVFFLGMVVPYNSQELIFASKSATSAAASPFVVAIKLAKIGGLDHVVNACLLIFVFSAANSGMPTSCLLFLLTNPRLTLYIHQIFTLPLELSTASLSTGRLREYLPKLTKLGSRLWRSAPPGLFVYLHT
jgi:amino acid permease